MEKSQRDQQVERTQRAAWMVVAIAVVLMLLALRLNAPATVLWVLMLLMLLLGLGVQLWEYRTIDELAKLRLYKGWAVSGLCTSLSLSLLLFWATVNWAGGPAGHHLSQANLPLLGGFGVLIISSLSLSLTQFYLKRQDTCE